MTQLRLHRALVSFLLISAAVFALFQSEVSLISAGGGGVGEFTSTTIFSTHVPTTYVVTISETMYLTETISGISTVVPYSTAIFLSTVTTVYTSISTLLVGVMQNPVEVYLGPAAVIIAAVIGVIGVVGKRRDDTRRRRKKDVWDAIKEWVELTKSHGQQDAFPLAEKPPTLAMEIVECLSRNYPSIWADMQQFRSKYDELMAIKAGNVPEELFEKTDGRNTLNLDLLRAREVSLRHQLSAMQRQLTGRLNSEILEKHSTRLKY
jgi:hypothetical protein